MDSDSKCRSFCSEECLIASKFYASQLSETPVHLRTPGQIKPAILHPSSTTNQSKEESKENSIIKAESQMNEQMSELKIVERETPSVPIEKESISNDYMMIDGVVVDTQSKTTKSSKVSLSNKEIDDDLLLKKKSMVPELGFFGTLHVTLGNWVNHSTKLFLKGRTYQDEDSHQNVDTDEPEELPTHLTDEIIMKKNALFSVATL